VVRGPKHHFLFHIFHVSTIQKKDVTPPRQVYLAFVVSLYIEMYGVPLTAYVLMWLFGYNEMYTLEYLLSNLIGKEMFYQVFMYVVFPVALVILVAGMLLINFWLERNP
jgi:hypothetical protein